MNEPAANWTYFALFLHNPAKAISKYNIKKKKDKFFVSILSQSIVSIEDIIGRQIKNTFCPLLI